MSALSIMISKVDLSESTVNPDFYAARMELLVSEAAISDNILEFVLSSFSLRSVFSNLGGTKFGLIVYPFGKTFMSEQINDDSLLGQHIESDKTLYSVLTYVTEPEWRIFENTEEFKKFNFLKNAMYNELGWKIEDYKFAILPENIEINDIDYELANTLWSTSVKI
jgi:hypothetical protein